MWRGAFEEDCWGLAARALVAKPHGTEIQHTTALHGRGTPPTFGVSSRRTIPLRAGTPLFFLCNIGQRGASQREKKTCSLL